MYGFYRNRKISPKYINREDGGLEVSFILQFGSVSEPEQLNINFVTCLHFLQKLSILWTCSTRTQQSLN